MPATSRTCSQCATTSSMLACGRGASVGSRSQSRSAWLTKYGTNVTMHTPPLSARRASTSSGTLRGWSHSARAEECEKITGAWVVSRAARMVSADTWERSTSMPRRFISSTTSRPNADKPPTTGVSVAESAHGTLSLWVRVR